MTTATEDPFSAGRLGPLTLRNRVIKSATFEGLATDGLVTDALIDYHRAVAAGGVGMSTVAFLAISPDARSAPTEMVLRPQALPGLRRLTDAIHQEGAAASAQIGHAGPVGGPPTSSGLSPSRVFSPISLRFTKPASADDLADVVSSFASAARLAVEAGFDAVEIHMGHGYLISSFLSPRLNRRDDRYGGSMENRARLARDVARAVRDAVADKVAVTAKLNMADGVPGGLWLDDSVPTALLLEADGNLDALVLTAGSSFQNMMYMFRGEPPLRELGAAFPQPLRTGFKLVGKRFLPELPFEEAYFLPYARQFREALSMPLVLLGGVNRLDTVRRALAEGFPFVAMARALLREPDLVNRMREQPSHEALCVHCNKCVPTIYSGTHCVLVRPEQRPGRGSRAPLTASVAG